MINIKLWIWQFSYLSTKYYLKYFVTLFQWDIFRHYQGSNHTTTPLFKIILVKKVVEIKISVNSIVNIDNRCQGKDNR